MRRTGYKQKKGSDPNDDTLFGTDPRFRQQFH